MKYIICIDNNGTLIMLIKSKPYFVLENLYFMNIDKQIMIIV